MQTEHNSQEPKNAAILNTPHIRRRLLSYYHPHRKFMPWILLCHLLTVGFDLVGPIVLGWTTDVLLEVDQQGGSSAVVWKLAGLFFLVMMIKNVFRFLRGCSNAKVGMAILNRFRNQLLKTFLRLPFRYHDQASSGDLIARTTRDVEKLAGLYFDLFLNGIEVILLVIGLVTILFLMHWQLGLVILANATLTFLCILGYARYFRKLSRESADSYDLVTQRIQENVAGVRVVKAFGTEDKEKRGFRETLKDFVGKEIKAYDFLFQRMPMANHTYNLAIPLAFVVGGHLVVTGVLTPGNLVTTVFLLSFVGHRMRMIGQLVQFTQEGLASADRIFEVLDQPDEIVALEPCRTLPPGKGDVTMRNLSFGYKDNVPVLKQLSFDIKGGETIGVIGITGGGKSTLASLLARHYEADAGEILVEGVDIRHIDPLEYRRAVVAVFQESFLFSMSIRDNILFGRPEASEDEMIEAARAAQIHDFVLTLHEGYDTMLGERGVSLSGGQKQRVAIARALIMRPRVLLLDDATASVDAGTERKLQKAWRTSLQSTTTIIISQRVVSVRDADRILVLQDGAIVQAGTHDELLEQEGLYLEMVRLQTLQEVCRDI